MLSSPAPLRALIVDDNTVNRMVAAEMLESHGITTAEAEDGYAGWSLLRESKYDVVLLDISMPGIDGRTLCRKVRESELNADSFIVAYTAHAFPAQKQAFLSTGFDALLVKPVSYDGLAETIRPILGDADGNDADDAGRSLDFL